MHRDVSKVEKCIFNVWDLKTCIRQEVLTNKRFWYSRKNVCQIQMTGGFFPWLFLQVFNFVLIFKCLCFIFRGKETLAVKSSLLQKIKQENKEVKAKLSLQRKLSWDKSQTCLWMIMFLQQVKFASFPVTEVSIHMQSKQLYFFVPNPFLCICKCL